VSDQTLSVTVDEHKVMAQGTLVVTISTPYKIRKWIAFRLIELAVWVLGMRGVEFEEEDIEQLT
jgi:hypothetical protein